jgi:hypothetical protein
MQGELSTHDETAQPTCGNCSEGNRGMGCRGCYIGDLTEYDHRRGRSITGSTRFEAGFGVQEAGQSEGGD